eukprot:XP_001699341.1 predicted protein [Chlamydomonas reinhardtii]
MSTRKALLLELAAGQVRMTDQLMKRIGVVVASYGMRPARGGWPGERDRNGRLFLQHAAGLHWPLVSTAAAHAAATAEALATHVGLVMDLDPYTGSEMYTARNTGIVVEDTLRLINKYRWSGPPITQMDRNKAGTSTATTERKRPDFLCWVKGALMFKGEEKALSSELHLAISELTSKMSTVWAKGLLPHLQPPCMLAFAAAGTILQALLCSCNISRLLAGYASQAPLVPLEMGRLVSSDDGMRTYCLLPGCFRKVIREFASEHAQYGSFELLQCVYRQMAQKKHRSKIIQACDIDGHIGPRLLDNTYTVHLAPVGDPCSGPPADPLDLPCAVAGVLGGLAALHSEGFVHRDVRWANVIFLPAEKRWLLIDLDHAGRSGCDCSGEPYPLRFWSKRTLDDGKYTFRSDLRMAAEQLLCGLPYDLDDGGINLRMQLLEGQLTATQALEHAWLAQYTSSSG